MGLSNSPLKAGEKRDVISNECESEGVSRHQEKLNKNKNGVR